MSLRKGISELYVDIMLTLIVISLSGAFTALLTDLSNYLRSDHSLSVGVPPLALSIKYGGRNYLIVVNYGDSPLEIAVMYGGTKTSNYVVNPQSPLIIDLDNVDPSNTYVLVSNYLVRVNSLELR
ncbi:MAG: hypothetical protein QW267_05450 [Sulfolobales archaeon]